MNKEYRYTGFIKDSSFGWFGTYYFEPKNKIWYIYVDGGHDGKIFIINGFIENASNGKTFTFMVNHDNTLDLIGKWKYKEPKLPIPKYVQEKIKEIAQNISNDKYYYKDRS